MKCGVPQGSISSLFMFIMYIIKLANASSPLPILIPSKYFVPFYNDECGTTNAKNMNLGITNALFLKIRKTKCFFINC